MRKVLVADDDRLVRELIKQNLRPLFTVTTVCNGEEAITELVNQSFDLMLLDLNMPLCDGWQTIIRMRQELNVRIPVIAVSSYILPCDRSRAASAGCCGFVPKPIETSKLMEAVQTALSKGLWNFNQLGG